MAERQLTIRPVHKRDIQSVWELHNRALEGTGAHAGNGEWDEDVRDPIGSYQSSGGYFLVCEIEGLIVGMGAYAPIDESSVEIKRMRVDPDEQGAGIGWRILSALEADAKTKGFKRAILETTMQQTAAQALYERNGYMKTRESRLGRFRVIHYEKSLK